MAFTYGFFNSLRGDRKYDAEQFSSIFDGILKDGIIPSYGQLFDVNTANNGMQITVGTGRAWFNHTWSLNDSVMILTVPQSDITRPRYDAVVLEVNHEQDVRANSIKIVSGIASVNAAKPTLVDTDKVKQYPLAYILVKAGTEEIKAEDIENMVGRTPTVFATGILETVAIDDLWSQWEGEWQTWFASIKLQLSGDIVTNLQLQIDELREGVKYLNDTFEVKEIAHNDVIASSGVWTNTTGKEINVSVLVFGGGGGGGAPDASTSGTTGGGGGGGGYMARGSYTIAAGQTVNVTIGTGGAGGVKSGSGSNGGTSSFGTYISANGGGGAGAIAVSGRDYGIAGGSGGTGGGGGGGADGGDGGNGGYGGGGGAGAGESTSSNGGNGGTYGGGGGGAGHKGYLSNTAMNVPGGSGGSGGAQGGSGGAGGRAQIGQSMISGYNGNAGTDTTQLNLDYKGTGTGGRGGTGGTSGTNPTNTCGGGGGGGGGGGYGGNGGRGGNAGPWWESSNGQRQGAAGGSGGGGGGYGANGGNGGDSSNHTTYCGGGGGGGGYGGPGKAGGDSTTKYGGGGGGYGPSNLGSGGNGSKAPPGEGYSYSGDAGSPGVIIVTYVTREVVVS